VSNQPKSWHFQWDIALIVTSVGAESLDITAISLEADAYFSSFLALRFRIQQEGSCAL
jgi:hypothetical protein